MANINEQRARYFKDHPLVEFGWFTSDDQAFLPNNEHYATAHAENLRRKGETPNVDKITRTECDAWTAEQEQSSEIIELPGKTAQEQLADAQAAFDKATNGGNVEEIATAKKALTAAKGRVTREAKKSA